MKLPPAFDRRKVLLSLSGLFGLAAAGAWLKGLIFQKETQPMESDSVIKKKFSLDFQWPTLEPFLFCVHHFDRYPRGNERFAPPPETLRGRDLGQDFVEKDGFRMYHGDSVPGFPVHPHRGFETVTIVRKGYVDHADSIGAAGRYGQGDVQWMTAGRGVQHSEMFPLLKKDDDNTVELFQIWLNLPRKNKMVDPHFKMFWSEDIPTLSLQGGSVQLTLIAGEFEGTRPPKPPPDSWASDPSSNVQIWLLKLDPKVSFKIPDTSPDTIRTFYFFEGESVSVNGERLSSRTGFVVEGHSPLTLQAGKGPVEILLLQARPIGEPVVQHGPFVMNSQAEIIQTFQDYQKTRFGGWSWPRQDMVHGKEIRRFAKYPDGRIETPDEKA
jgi:quercetin 2,3-dioxygenase